MSLTLDQKSAFAVRLVAARLLDSACINDTAEKNLIDAAAATLEAHAVNAVNAVFSETHVSRFVSSAAEGIEDLASHSRRVFQAKAALMDMADQMPGDGSGVPWARQAGACKRSGILELAEMIEAYVRSEAARAGVALADHPPIQFFTGIGALRADFGSFHIAGYSNIDADPRQIVIKCFKGKFAGRDVNHISYNLFHELVCHGLQNYQSGNKQENTEDGSPWTEGWMDTVAFAMAAEWLSTGPSDWIPAQGADALAHVRRFHDERYEPVDQLTFADMARRRNARNCFYALARRLKESWLVHSDQEAVDQVKVFSLLLNTHGLVRVSDLDNFVTFLWNLLRPAGDSGRAARAAKACLSFVTDQNPTRLLTAVRDLHNAS
jgi:hypothetical protein